MFGEVIMLLLFWLVHSRQSRSDGGQIDLIHIINNNTATMSNQVQAKRVSIRANIRKQDIQTFLANKRSVLLHEFEGRTETSSLRKILNDITSGDNHTELHLRRMANQLAKSRPFDNLSDAGIQSTSEEITQFCIQLSTIILETVALEYRTESREDIQGRINCLSIITNLLADDLCPNHYLTEQVCEYIRKTYCSVEIWGVDKEIVEVGWVMSNLIGSRQVAWAEPKSIEYILQWIQQLCQMRDSPMLILLYKALPVFVTALQQRYSLKKYEMPQLHINRFINIVSQTIYKNTVVQTDIPPSTLLPILNFLIECYPIIVAHCPPSLCETLMEEAVHSLGSISKSIVKASCKLLIKMCSLFGQQFEQKEVIARKMAEKIKYLLVKHYSSKLLTIFILKEKDMKVEIIILLTQIVQPSHQSLYLIQALIYEGLEEALISILDVAHPELIISCFELVQTIRSQCEDLLQNFILSADILNKSAIVLPSSSDSHPI